MSEEVLYFFDKHPDALPLYETFEDKVRTIVSDVRIKVQKTQISFYNKHMFACVSFARVRKKKDCPENFIVVTLSLNHKLESPRVDIATEPYPNRWTHHLLISDMSEIDEELMEWVEEAAEFAARK
ncbi:MAG TPA: hypothetical protein H9934_11740 [Candidatus Anaerobutyricum faecale]|uniref:DUF5655 domain-containing protein n=1 Tax=Eubacterium sp. An11 TaxID=1965542 RepID=UPI000B3A5D51|nr:DUF5655 domain-containing protein [Eubacterium sp. An11]OUQ64002.1 hypothetical protein B5E53_14795 [Eubacterium sp. An11]HJC32787.1 hypothetical protein [Candidatus Anaerobutyricum faecale]